MKTIQSVMRHSDIKLTPDRYGHLFPGSEADAVAKLRFAFCTNEALLATGTQGSTPHTYSRIDRSQGTFSNESGQGDAGANRTAERCAKKFSDNLTRRREGAKSM